MDRAEAEVSTLGVQQASAVKLIRIVCLHRMARWLAHWRDPKQRSIQLIERKAFVTTSYSIVSQCYHRVIA